MKEVTQSTHLSVFSSLPVVLSLLWYSVWYRGASFCRYVILVVVVVVLSIHV